MLTSRQKRRVAPENLCRRVLLSWLLAVTVEFLLLPTSFRRLEGLEALEGMSAVRTVCLMCGCFLLLWAASLFFDTRRTERWLIVGTFVVLSGACLYAAFSPALLCALLLCLALLLVYAWKGAAAKTEPRTAPERGRRPALCLTVVFALVFFVFASLWTVCRVLAYRTPTYDFGIFSQMFHQMRTTGLPTTTLERDGLLSHFKVHVSPIYYLLLPFYCICPKPATLQLLQAALLASAAIPLWLLAKKHGFSPILRSLLCLLLFLYPAYSGGAAYDLHENAFLTPLLFWLFYAMDCGSGWRVALFAALTLMVKEDAAVYVAAAGLYLTARSLRKTCDRKGVKTGLLLLLASVGWFFAVTTYLSRCGDGVMAYRYENFMPEGTSSLLSVMKTVLLLPMKVLYECVETEKLEFLALTLLPLLGLPFLTRQYERFLLLIPYVLVNLMSDYPYQHDIYFQYTFGATAFLFYLTLLNLSELMRAFPKPVFLARLPLFLALLTALGCFYPSSLGRGAFYIKLYDTNRTSYAQIDAFLQTLPEDASVAATTFYTTALSNRAVLYDVKYASTEHLLCAEYILLDSSDTASYQKYGGLADFIRFLQACGYTETDRLGEQLLLFQKETRAETRVP
ncbi:MAG: DUF2079 domain-containing protein [Faecousia sp.]